jgi:enterochelin esterase-like enzyme
MVPFFTTEASDSAIDFVGLRFFTVKSNALGRRVDVTVWVPEGAERTENLPVVVLLHGVYGSHWAWALKGGAHVVARQLIEAGEIRPIALAMPSDGLWGDGSGYLTHRAADYERWVVHEVPTLLCQQVPGVTETSPLFLAGLSMGGYGALRLGAKFGERFRGVSGLSSITRFEELGDFFEKNDLSRLRAEGVREEAVFDVLHQNRHHLPPFRFDCGLADPLLQSNRLLHRQLTEAGIAHGYFEYEGGHEWPYWRTHLSETLRFFNGLLA